MPFLNVGRDQILALILGEAVTPYNNANAALGVGNSTTAVVATQTDLQGASKARKAMDATYPQRSANVATYRATFGTSEANFAWEEVIVANSPTLAAGVVLLRVVSALGTKTSAATWQLTLTQTVTV